MSQRPTGSRPAPHPAPPDPAVALAEQLAADLKRLGDFESSLQFHLRGYWLPIAQRILASYLVVPRAEIAGTEYGWRRTPDDQVSPRADRGGAVFTVETRCGGEAVERPALPWSVIPLPERGD